MRCVKYLKVDEKWKLLVGLFPAVLLSSTPMSPHTISEANKLSACVTTLLPRIKHMVIFDALFYILIVSDFIVSSAMRFTVLFQPKATWNGPPLYFLLRPSWCGWWNPFTHCLLDFKFTKTFSNGEQTVHVVNGKKRVADKMSLSSVFVLVSYLRLMFSLLLFPRFSFFLLLF